MRVLSFAMLAALGIAGCGSAAAEDTIKVGIARSTSNAAELMALKHGYFKEAGIKLEWDDIDSTANVIALLAQDKYQIVAGGISAGIFNALEKNLPITILSDRVSTPIGHNLMLRPDLKDTVKSLKDLKGKVVASNGQGSVSTYETGKMLEGAGLKLSDVDLKIFPFTQMGLAFKNKAIDAGLLIPPFTWNVEAQGLAIPFADVDQLVQPQPMTIAVIMANSDWVKGHKDLVQRYMTAWLRGAREYCQAYTARRTARRSSTSWSTPRPRRAGSCWRNSRGRRAAPTARSTPRACSTSTPGTSPTRCRHRNSRPTA